MKRDTTAGSSVAGTAAAVDVNADLGGPMKWSVRLGRVAGIGVYMHATFVLLIVWVTLAHFINGHGVASTFLGVTFVLTLFGCVVFHELGHALMARRFGIRTRDITLLPIGGVARLERMPEKPVQEMLVALAGPAVNVVIAATILVWLVLAGTADPWAEVGAKGSFLGRLMVVNVSLAVFNMVPAFPMDGGRVLRALLAMTTDYARATRIAATVGQGVALLLGLVGLFGNPMLLFIALFVWIGASEEASMTEVRSALAGLRVARATMTDYRQVAPGDTLADAVSLVLAGSQRDFPVVDAGRVVGMLGRSDIQLGLALRGPGAPVADAMRREIETVDADEMLERVMPRLAASRLETLPVSHEGRLVGLLTAENVGELVLFRSVLSTSPGAPEQPRLDAPVASAPDPSSGGAREPQARRTVLDEFA